MTRTLANILNQHVPQPVRTFQSDRKIQAGIGCSGTLMDPEGHVKALQVQNHVGPFHNICPSALLKALFEDKFMLVSAVIKSDMKPCPGTVDRFCDFSMSSRKVQQLNTNCTIAYVTTDGTHAPPFTEQVKTEIRPFGLHILDSVPSIRLKRIQSLTFTTGIIDSEYLPNIYYC